MKLLTTMAVLLFGLSACDTGSRGPSTRGSYESAFEATAEAANTQAGSPTRIVRCGQTPGRRLGYCITETPPTSNMAMQFERRLGATYAPSETTVEWATSPNSGCAQEGWLSLHPGAKAYLIPSLALLQNGTRIDRAWIDGPDACLDLGVPRG